MKKKLKKKLMVFGIVGFFLVGALGLFGSGLYAIYSLVAGLIDQLPDGGFWDDNYEHHLTMSDLSDYDLDKMIEVAGDPKVFDDEMLDALFMERTTFQNLLKRVKDNNELFDEADKTIGKMHYWYETIEVSGPPDEDGNPTTTTETIFCSSEVSSAYHVTAADYEKHYYQEIFWPSLYVSAVADVLSNYQVEAIEIQSGNSIVDNSDESGELVLYAKTLIGSNTYTNLEYVRSVFSHFDMELPLDALTVADAFADRVGSGVCVPLSEVQDKLTGGDIVCFAADGAIIQDGSTLVRTYTGSGADITIGIYAGNDTVFICEDGVVKQVSLQNYAERFYSARRTAMSEEARNTVEIDGQEVVKSDGYTGNKIGDFVGNWVPANEDQRKKNDDWSDFIEEAASTWNLPPDLIRAFISQESGWDPNCVSETGARGVMQVMQSTWDAMCVKCGYAAGSFDQLSFDPKANIMVGSAYLADVIYNSANGDLIDGIGMYFQGPKGYASRGYKESFTKVKHADTDLVNKMSYFCNKQFTLNDILSGNYDSVADGFTGFGYISTNGRLVLTEGQLDVLFNVFKTYFSYAFDVVRDEKMSYSYAECSSLPNYGLKVSGSVGDDWYEWYEPVSQLDLAETPWLDVYYAYLNIESKKVIRNDRWVTNQKQIWEVYDGPWYEALTDVLPLGVEARYRYDLYGSKAESVVEYEEDANHALYAGAGPDVIGGGIVDGSTIGWATGGGYNIPDGYTSIKIPESAGGMAIPLYLQGDSQWGTIRFGGGTIASSGCGAASMAMIVTYLTGKQVTPDMIVSRIGNKYYTPGEGQSWEMPGGVAKLYGITLRERCKVNAETILQSLKKGYPVLVTTSGYGTTKEFTKAGHYIVLRGLDSNGKVLVNDPNDNTTTKQHYLKAYDVNFIVSECHKLGVPKEMWVFSK